MLWEDKVNAWKVHPVTKAFFADMQKDVDELTHTLIYCNDPREIAILQGMIRGIMGMLGAPDDDGIPEPDKKENDDAL